MRDKAKDEYLVLVQDPLDGHGVDDLLGSLVVGCGLEDHLSVVHVIAGDVAWEMDHHLQCGVLPSVHVHAVRVEDEVKLCVAL